MYATHMCNGSPPIKCSGSGASDTVLTNRHLVKLGLIKSEERKRCPLLTTPHCKKSTMKSVRIVKRQSGCKELRSLDVKFELRHAPPSSAEQKQLP
ncbi:hypothetical protein EVAR_66099_1 [Eumeta japonica]|uniref:Uncharacterized protein n=1 Tax=Eumeta variegata TaxID=151549 RepID=A0A4C1ZWT3_EUMVA|nr:hypothetical protein EVAR_66099_1 [Eumeta japonica]